MDDRPIVFKDERAPVIVHYDIELDDSGLDPYEFRAYQRIARRCAGASTGQCCESLASMAFGCRMSRAKLAQAIKGLIERRMIARRSEPGQVSFYALLDKSRWLDPSTTKTGGVYVVDTKKTHEENTLKKTIEEDTQEKKKCHSTKDCQCQAVFDYWKEKLNHPKAFLDKKRRHLIEARLKEGYLVADLKLAIDGCAASSFHMGENEQGRVYDGLDLICRDASKVDQFIGYANKTPAILNKRKTNGNGNGHYDHADLIEASRKLIFGEQLEFVEGEVLND